LQKDVVKARGGFAKHCGLINTATHPLRGRSQAADGLLAGPAESEIYSCDGNDRCGGGPFRAEH
jgi:hypothetical protein